MQSDPPNPSLTGQKSREVRRQRHPMREILYRVSDLRLVTDTAFRAVTKAWDLVSPLEFSVLYRQVRLHTMCSNARLRGLYDGVRYVLHHDVPGDLVECGCARGGSAALMSLDAAPIGITPRDLVVRYFCRLASADLGRSRLRNCRPIHRGLPGHRR